MSVFRSWRTSRGPGGTQAGFLEEGPEASWVRGGAGRRDAFPGDREGWPPQADRCRGGVVRQGPGFRGQEARGPARPQHRARCGLATLASVPVTWGTRRRGEGAEADSARRCCVTEAAGGQRLPGKGAQARAGPWAPRTGRTVSLRFLSVSPVSSSTPRPGPPGVRSSDEGPCGGVVHQHQARGGRKGANSPSAPLPGRGQVLAAHPSIAPSKPSVWQRERLPTRGSGCASLPPRAEAGQPQGRVGCEGHRATWHGHLSSPSRLPPGAQFRTPRL